FALEVDAGHGLTDLLRTQIGQLDGQQVFQPLGAGCKKFFHHAHGDAIKNSAALYLIDPRSALEPWTKAPYKRQEARQTLPSPLAGDRIPLLAGSCLPSHS